MGLVIAPIVEGKVEAWRQWTGEMTGPRRSDFDDFNERYGLTRHSAWFAETPAGPMAVVLHEGPGGDEFMQKLATSDHEFDKSFRAKVEEFHGIDLSAPPPGPPPELVLDS